VYIFYPSAEAVFSKDRVFQQPQAIALKLPVAESMRWRFFADSTGYAPNLQTVSSAVENSKGERRSYQSRKREDEY
jgi:hypothetical protein